MAKPETRIEIFLATPGDVLIERTIVFEEVTEWNETHSAALSASLHLKHWRNATYPEMGDRPQATINRQALDSTDLLVAIFWTRFGSPTGVAESGTEEEIRRSVASGRPVMLYFSDAPFSPDQVDAVQCQHLLAFRSECRSSGRYESYRSPDEFRALFRKHLAFRIHSLLKRLRTDDVGAAVPQISFQGENHGIVGTVHAQNVTINAPKGRSRRNKGTGIISGSLKGDLLKWNYISYLVRQYDEFRGKGAAWGDMRGFSYGFIRKRIEQEFGSPAGNLPVTRFEDVADFLKGYVDGTILGRNNRSKGIRNYVSFEEFIARQTELKPKRRSRK
jgi:hypothetical protein